MNDDSNHFGRKVAKLRWQKGWTQDIFVAKLQVHFHALKISRDILANIETKRCVATHHHVYAFAVVLGVDPGDLFRP